MAVKINKLKAGHYTIARQGDGAVFTVIRGLNGRWIVESPEGLLDDFSTLTVATLAIDRRWTPQTGRKGRDHA